jgi:hypothetical protein
VLVCRCRCRGRPGLWPFTCQPGPDWPCNVCTFGLILGPTVPFLLLVAPKLHWAVVLAGILLTGVTAALLALTAFSDPGYVPKQTPAQMEAQRQQMEEQGLSGTFTVCRECCVGVARLGRTGDGLGGLSTRFTQMRQVASGAVIRMRFWLCGWRGDGLDEAPHC